MWDKFRPIQYTLSHMGPLIWRENLLKCHCTKVLWDITTKFLPVKEHIRIQLSSKFRRCCMENKPAMPLTFSNFSRARQAHFLSYDLQIWWEVITFKGAYVMWFWFWYLSRYGIWKNVKSCTLHLTELFVLPNETTSETTQWDFKSEYN